MPSEAPTKPPLRPEPPPAPPGEDPGDIRRSRLYLLSRGPVVSLVRRGVSVAALVAADVAGLALGLYSALVLRSLVGNADPALAHWWTTIQALPPTEQRRELGLGSGAGGCGGATGEGTGNRRRRRGRRGARGPRSAADPTPPA